MAAENPEAEHRTRLFVEAELRPGAAVALDAGRAHYLRHVLRARPGERVALFNGRDGEWLARLSALGKRAGEAAVERRTRPQAAEPDIWLAFAPIKRAPVDFLARKAAELGAAALWPVFTRFTSVERVNLARLRANAVEAAEQTGRLAVPEVRAPARFDEMLASWPEGRTLFCCDETGAGAPALAAFAARRGAPAGLLVGPEGGFAAAELDALARFPNVCRVSLGPRLLRADTAALAALACWQAAAGDWADGGSRPPPGAAA